MFFVVFCLCGETTEENPNGSTGASIAGAGTLERSDDGQSAGPAVGRGAQRRVIPFYQKMKDLGASWGFSFLASETVDKLSSGSAAQTPQRVTKRTVRVSPAWYAAIFSPHFLSPAKVISAIAEGFCVPQKRERAGEAHAAHDSPFESARPCPESWQSGGLKQRAFIGRFGARTTPRKT